VTHDGNNYAFSSTDQPGIIYLPAGAAGAGAGAGSTTAARTAIGCVVRLRRQAGTQFIVVGIETVAGWLFSLDDAGKGMVLTSSVNRVGPGAGVGLGLCFILVTGVSQPSQLNGWQQGDWDFNLSLGENWGKAVQGVAKVRRLRPLIDFVASTGARTPKALKQALNAHPDRWVDLIKQARSLKDSLGLNSNGEPNVFMFDVPFISGGAEVSVFYGLSNFTALHDNT